MMVEVRELSNKEIETLITRLDYGHLGCCSDGEPYVVPVHYAYKNGLILVYTTQGKKAEIISKNPRVCLQIEVVRANDDWSSAIIYGEAQELREEQERTEAIESLVRINPTLTPAVSIHWMDNWVRENIEVVYRIVPLEMTGREAVKASKTTGSFVSTKKPDSPVH